MTEAIDSEDVKWTSKESKKREGVGFSHYLSDLNEHLKPANLTHNIITSSADASIAQRMHLSVFKRLFLLSRRSTIKKKN